VRVGGLWGEGGGEGGHSCGYEFFFGGGGGLESHNLQQSHAGSMLYGLVLLSHQTSQVDEQPPQESWGYSRSPLATPGQGCNSTCQNTLPDTQWTQTQTVASAEVWQNSSSTCNHIDLNSTSGILGTRLGQGRHRTNTCKGATSLLLLLPWWGNGRTSRTPIGLSTCKQALHPRCWRHGNTVRCAWYDTAVKVSTCNTTPPQKKTK
jgi:hypothetical protein